MTTEGSPDADAPAPGRDVTPGVRRDLVRVSAALAGGDREALGECLDRLAREERFHEQVEEVLLQAYLFLGFPAVLDAFGAWRERVPGPGNESPEGGEDAGGSPGHAEDELGEWMRRGRSLCRRVYGDAYEGLRRNVGRLHPSLDRWMILEGYGKVLSRPHLDPGIRELCIVAVLAASSREPQLHSHLRGALRVGASPAEVTEALEEGIRRSAPSTRDGDWPATARDLWNRVRADREV